MVAQTDQSVRLVEFGSLTSEDRFTGMGGGRVNLRRVIPARARAASTAVTFKADARLQTCNAVLLLSVFASYRCGLDEPTQRPSPCGVHQGHPR